MENNKKSEVVYRSQREQHYYEEIVPKLSEEILKMNLGMRANIVLANSDIYTIDALRQKVEKEEHIQYLDKESLAYIKSYFRIK